MYPEDSVQFMLHPSQWWDEDETHDYGRGRLVKAFIPHVDQVPKTLTAIGRSEPTDHAHAHVKIEPFRIRTHRKIPGLPVAALPLYDNEVHTVYQAKKRPALIICEGGPAVEKALTLGKPKWQTSPTLLVAPYYGVDEGYTRAGFNPEFIKRVRRCEYPQFMWDKLPIGGSTKEALLRLDHIQPVGRHHDSIELTKYRLSEDALNILDDWLGWLIEGCFDEDSYLYALREEILSIFKI